MGDCAGDGEFIDEPVWNDFRVIRLLIHVMIVIVSFADLFQNLVIERRREMVYEIQRYLLDNVVARLDFLSEIDRGTQWPYLKNQAYAPWFGDLHSKANVCLDSTDPTYQGRKA